MTKLQAQQIKLNELVAQDFGKVAIVLEGRDTAGKTGTIREFTHYLQLASILYRSAICRANGIWTTG